MDLYKKARKCSLERNDCSVIAISILANIPYEEAYKVCEKLGRKKNGGMYEKDILKAFKRLRCRVEPVSMIHKRKGTRDYKKFTYWFGYSLKRVDEQLRPKGRDLISTSGHVSAYVNGRIEDWAAGRKKIVQKVWEIRPPRKNLAA